MEWWQTTLIGIIVALPAVGWSMYVFRQTRADKQREQSEDVILDLTTEIAADGASIRREVRDQLKEAIVRSDRIEEILMKTRDEIFELKEKVNNLSFLKVTLERDKAILLEDKRNLVEQNTMLREEVKELRGRVFELEKEVNKLVGNQER